MKKIGIKKKTVDFSSIWKKLVFIKKNRKKYISEDEKKIVDNSFFAHVSEHILRILRSTFLGHFRRQRRGSAANSWREPIRTPIRSTSHSVANRDVMQ